DRPVGQVGLVVILVSHGEEDEKQADTARPDVRQDRPVRHAENQTLEPFDQRENSAGRGAEDRRHSPHSDEECHQGLPVEPVATPAPLLRHALSRLGHSLVHQGTEHGTPWPHRDTLLVSLDAEKRHHQEDDPETGHGHVTGPGVLRDLDLLLLYGQVHLYLSFSGWVPCGAHPLSDRDERASRPASRYG